MQWDIRGKAFREDFIAGWVGIWMYKEEKRIFRAEETKDTEKREQVTCLDNSTFSLAGAYEREPAGMKLKKYVRARLSLLNVKTIPGIK